MKNKYAICMSLYDNYKLSETNLYYYKGILELISIKDRDFDIYVDTTEYCYNILLKIIEQEELNTENIFFNIQPESSNSSGMLWRFYRMFHIAHKYDVVGTNESDCNNTCRLKFSTLFKVNNHPIYTFSCVYKPYNIYSFGFYDMISSYGGGSTFISYKNLKTDYNKILYVLDNIFNNNNIKKMYQFDEYLLDSLLKYETINDNYCVLCKEDEINKYKNYICITHTEKYSYIPYNKMIYYKDGIYKLNNKQLIMNDTKPKTLQNDVSTEIYIHNKNKNLYLNVQKYILGYINKINIDCY